MKRILLDVDEVVCFAGFLDAVNEFMHTNYVIDDFTTYYIDVAAIPENKMADFNTFLDTKNLYENPTLLPDAVSVIEKLSKKYDIYLCTACVNPFNIEGSGRIFKDKYDFLIKALPFIDPSHYIFTSTKNIFKADIQIDDRMKNFDEDIPIKILFPSYHNKEIPDDELASKGITRAGNDWKYAWQEIEKILLKEDK